MELKMNYSCSSTGQ